MQEHNAERKTIGRYRRKTQQKNIAEKITENEDRAHNNHIDTDRIRKTILIFPVFCPQRHEKVNR